tara:strand:+ start:1034 stop:1726 length:693 start_codon:yes stop_codon:yes gene_type:complete
MSNYNTISLDAADTLFYIKEGLGNTYNNILKKYSDNYKSDDISKLFKKYFNSREGLHFDGLSGQELYTAEKSWWHSVVYDIFTDLGMFDQFDDYFEDLYNHFSFDAWEIYDDTIPFLKELKKRKLKIIISSNFDSRIFKVCDGFGITEYIDYFTISSESGFSKPSPEFFYKSLENSNSVINETVHVGDNYELDYIAANKIGITAFLIDRDSNKKEEYIVNSLMEVINKVC